MIIKALYKVWSKIYEILTRKLSRKMIFAFSIIVSMTVIIPTMITYFKTTEVLKQEFIINNQNNIMLVNKNLEKYIEQLGEITLSPRNNVDGQFMRMLLEPSDEFVVKSYIEKQLKIMFYSRGNHDIESISLYFTSDNGLFLLSENKSGDYQVTLSNNSNYPQQEWYKKMLLDRSSFKYLEPGFLKNQNKDSLKRKTFLTFHRAIINVSNRKALGVISITLNQNELNKILMDLAVKEGECIGIFNNENIPLYVSDNKLADISKFLKKIKGGAGVNGGNFIWNDGKEEYYAIYDISPKNGFKFLKLTPIRLLNESAQKTRDLSLMIGIVFWSLFVLVTMFMSNAISRPLKKLSQQMDKVGDGNFEAKMEIKGNDEIAYLAKRFNSMTDKINELINAEYKAKISERNSRLKALEAQINPHFLYNSLQAISTKALLHGTRDIYLMIEALAKSLRYCIKESEMVELSRELEYVQNYLVLQKARFGERLMVEFNIQPEIMSISIPKLSIHTLVENSIEHALEKMAESILIEIEGSISGGKIAIAVKDNGPGIAPEKLEVIRHELSDDSWINDFSESIGLKNLYARLKLLFGNDAAVEILSSPSLGTEVRIFLPLEK